MSLHWDLGASRKVENLYGALAIPAHGSRVSVLIAAAYD
jgi:hypothetical protein